MADLTPDGVRMAPDGALQHCACGRIWPPAIEIIFDARKKLRIFARRNRA
ncbi:hypothetical protein FHW58_005350 [Duganella sp. 1224]|nr:hypothetical protein [Duganella sp. 1224]NYE64115.1 hypothetical protein [Duganella sp. 1224]